MSMKLPAWILAGWAVMATPGCELLHVARPVIEACWKELWTQGEKAGAPGPACRSQGDFAREHGWQASEAPQ
jgi:hypothetical protein